MSENRFRAALERGEFVVTFEAVPGRGACEASQEELIQLACDVWETGRIHAISVTDNPGGTPSLSADTFAEDLEAKGISAITHITCKDRNRSQSESQLYTIQRRGIENILCMSGDYVGAAFKGKAKPVFDLDSVTVLQLVAEMNEGRRYQNRKGETFRLKPANFYQGAVVSPFKSTEGETLAQLYKLKKKVAAGAKYIVSQVGFDARKLQEMLFLMQDYNLQVPLIANVCVMNVGIASAMRSGAIAGCYVSDKMFDVLSEETADSDNGKRARLLRAAKMIAIAKGLGCAGVHIGGVGLGPNDITFMLDEAKRIGDAWMDCLDAMAFSKENCFYYYEKDPETGLNLHAPAPRTEQKTTKDILGKYKSSRKLQSLFFRKGEKLNGTFVSREKSLEENKGRTRKHSIEQSLKTKRYGCVDCGDCGLFAAAYSCPMRECPKCERNGACGGSSDGWCEVYPGEKYCIWYKAYYRFKAYGEEEQMGEYIVPPNNWDNYLKSAWGSNVLGKDGYSNLENL